MPDNRDKRSNVRPRGQGESLDATGDGVDLLEVGPEDHEDLLEFEDDGGLAAKIRRQQLKAMITALEENYPSLRMFVYDERRVFSAPITVFGPLLGVIYVGHFYLSFRSKDRVRHLAEHFDGLIREATIDARDAAKWLQGLAATVKGR